MVQRGKWQRVTWLQETSTASEHLAKITSALLHFEPLFPLVNQGRVLLGAGNLHSLKSNETIVNTDLVKIYEKQSVCNTNYGYFWLRIILILQGASIWIVYNFIFHAYNFVTNVFNNCKPLQPLRVYLRFALPSVIHIMKCHFDVLWFGLFRIFSQLVLLFPLIN